jgi:hypothetical protein
MKKILINIQEYCICLNRPVNPHSVGKNKSIFTICLYVAIIRFYLFWSSDQTNNGSEISDFNMLICKNRK